MRGTKKEYKIPDMSVKEFKKKTLIADFLFVVGNVFNKKKVLYKIPRKALKPDNLVLKETYHISRFQNRKCMGKYVVKT